MRLPRARRSRATLVTTVVVVLALLGAGAWWMTRPARAAGNRTLTYTVSKGDVQQTVSSTGTLAAAHEADLDFAVAGTVTRVLVVTGDHVHRRQVLARVDDTSLRAALASAQAQLSAARTTYDDDTSNDASSSQLASDSAAIDSANAAVAQAQDDLDAAQLRSPITGTVASVDLARGDQVAGTAEQSQAGSDTTSQVVVVQPGRFVVDASVSGDDVTSLRKGMQAKLTLSGSSRTIFGTVSSVGMVADESSSGAATFPVTIAVTGVQHGLYPGTSVDVSIVVRQRSNVLTVPSIALSSSNDATYVDKVVGDSTKQTKVAIGRTYGAQTVIRSGLSAGDVIQLGRSFNRVSSSGTNGQGGNATFPGGSGLPGGLSGGLPGGSVQVKP